MTIEKIVNEYSQVEEGNVIRGNGSGLHYLIVEVPGDGFAYVKLENFNRSPFKSNKESLSRGLLESNGSEVFNNNTL